MALLHTQFFSDSLGMCTSVDIIIPESRKKLIGMESEASATYKTLYLLHGLSDDQTIWQRRTSIERYAARYGLAVVMPCGAKSWYTDMVNGDAYYTYISKELPEFCRSMFKGMSDKREDNYIAGLSMGGYGALKIGLNNPDKFCAIAAFSGALDVYTYAKTRHFSAFQNIFGDPESIPESMHDVYYLGKKVSALSERPSIYLWCGTEDFLIEDNRRFTKLLSECSYDHIYSESSGIHAWEYWDTQIEKVLSIWFQKG